MKFLAVASLVAIASAATVADLPSCAATCAVNAVKTSSCQITDTACLCKDTAYASALTSCVSTGCSADDQAKTLTVSKDLCSSAGASAGDSSSSASAPASAAPTKSEPASAVKPVIATGGAVAPINGTGYAGTSAKPVPYTGGADSLRAGQWMGLAALVGLVAL